MEKLGALALVVQVITEAIARLYPRYTVYVAAAVGMVVAYATQAGLLAAMGFEVGLPVIDSALTGLVLAGGAGVVSAVKSGLMARKKDAA